MVVLQGSRPAARNKVDMIFREMKITPGLRRGLAGRLEAGSYFSTIRRESNECSYWLVEEEESEEEKVW